MKQQKAITLIALVITIIVLLILAGITIATLTGENGILKKAGQAKEKTIEGELKEEIELAIMEIQTEEIPKGNPVNIETLANGQLTDRIEDIIVEIENDNIVGEYKGYEYTIDSNLKVTIGEKIKGISISYTLNPSNYTNGNIILKLNVRTSNGEITNIEVPADIVKNEDGTYTIHKNGTYTFVVTDSSGETKEKVIEIKKIDKVPPKDFELEIENVDKHGFTIIAGAEDGEQTDESVKSGIGKYKYYIDGNEYKETTQSKCMVTGLEMGTKYTIFVEAFDQAGNSKKTAEIIQRTKAETKEIYIDSIQGNDQTGDGSKNNPYATLDKIAEAGIIQKGYSYDVSLGNGTYQLTTKIFELNCNNEINLMGNKQNTILKVDGLYRNSGGGSKEYDVNIYRLVWEGIYGWYNSISLNTPLTIYNVVFKVTGVWDYGYFSAGGPIVIKNSISIGQEIKLRKNRTTVLLTNCCGNFTSGYETVQSDWNYQTNYITTGLGVNSENYQITSSESIWKNKGTGKNPDGTQANLGVYGGTYSWEK